MTVLVDGTRSPRNPSMCCWGEECRRSCVGRREALELAHRLPRPQAMVLGILSHNAAPKVDPKGVYQTQYTSI